MEVTAVDDELLATLLRPEASERLVRTSAGFLDTLPAARGGAPMAQGLFMEATAVSRIYNRLWRPFLFSIGARDLVSRDDQTVLLRRFLDGIGPLVDLSCGPGTFTQRLWNQPTLRPVIGLDLSPSMLTEAVRTSPGPTYVRGDAYDLPFRDGSVAAVVNSGALHLYSDPVEVLREVHRVLQPGGVLVVIAFVTVLGTLARVTRPLERRIGITRYTVGELRGFLTEAGFTDIEHARVAGQCFARGMKS